MIDIKLDNIKPQYNNTLPTKEPPRKTSASTIKELREIIKEANRIANDLLKKNNEPVYK